MIFPKMTHYMGANVTGSAIGARMEEFAAAGIKFLQLNPKDLQLMKDDAAYRKEMLHQAEANGLTIRDVHAPHQTEDSLGTPIPLELVVNSQLNAIDIAGSLGVTTITIHVGRSRRTGEFAKDFGLFPFVDLPATEKRICDALDILVPAAEKNKCVIALENLFLPTSCADVLTPIVEKYNSPHLGMCYDSGHALLVESQEGKVSDDIAEWIRIGWDDDTVIFQNDQLDRMLGQVVTTHLHDTNGKNDQHLFPGEGVANWDAIVERLKRAPRLLTLQTELIGRLAVSPAKEIVERYKMFNI